MSGVTPDGSEYKAARLVFRVGPMLGMIVYADLLNTEPDLALLETVAQSVAERASVVADRQTVPLGASWHCGSTHRPPSTHWCAGMSMTCVPLR